MRVMIRLECQSEVAPALVQAWLNEREVLVTLPADGEHPEDCACRESTAGATMCEQFAPTSVQHPVRLTYVKEL